MSDHEITPLIDEGECASRLGVTRQTLENYRKDGIGPPFFQFSERAIRYAWTDVELWLADRKFRSAEEYRKGIA